MKVKTTRWTMLAAGLTALLAVTGCKDSKDSGKASGSTSAAASGKTAASGAAAGSDACSQYVAALEACMAKVPKEQTAGLKSMLDAQKKAMESVSEPAKKQMQSGCQTGLATLKQNPLCK